LHGFALNCATDLRWYDAIVPCGLEAHGVTTLSALAGGDVAVADVAPHIERRFEEIFDVSLTPSPEPA